jgi:hypothetical protein
MSQLLAAVLAGGAAGVLGHSVLDRTRVRLEEYKIFIEDTSRYSDRRQTVSNIYVAVNTALVGLAAGFLSVGHIAPYGTFEWWRLLAVLALSIAGVTASAVWWALVRRYEQIIGARVARLRKIEHALPGSHKMYHKMDVAFCGKVPSFSGPEKILPIVFIVLDSLLFSSALVASALGLAALCACQ